MERQKEIKKDNLLLGEDGCIQNPGWARSEVWKYNRENIHAPWFRKKEWDYYMFANEKFAVAFTISDLGYIGLLSVSFINLEEKWEHTESDLVVFPRGQKFGLQTSVDNADAHCETKRLKMEFRGGNGKRSIKCNFKNFDQQKNFTADIDIIELPMEPLYIATPWKEKKTAFYYNCKKNCLSASGMVQYGNNKYELAAGENLGVLDWGRGVWTYDNTWYWGIGSGYYKNEPYGLNLGYGFSDRSSASENVLYYKGKIHKLDEVTFEIPIDSTNKRRYEDEWRITSNNGRLKAVFSPIIDRNASMDFKIIKSIQHQVFGKMNGTVISDDGEEIQIRNLLCALECVRNKY